MLVQLDKADISFSTLASVQKVLRFLYKIISLGVQPGFLKFLGLLKVFFNFLIFVRIGKILNYFQMLVENGLMLFDVLISELIIHNHKFEDFFVLNHGLIQRLPRVSARKNHLVQTSGGFEFFRKGNFFSVKNNNLFSHIFGLL